MGSGVFLSFFLFLAAFGLPIFSFEWHPLEKATRNFLKGGGAKGNKTRTKDTSH